jgi:glycosyltransferase involved in cell wall biosynthesis
VTALGLDVSATDPFFKAHSSRGIGRYVRALSDGLPVCFNAITQDGARTDGSLTFGTFTHRDFSLPSWAERCISILPLGQQTVRQQVCYPLQLGKFGKTADFQLLHFPAHMDAPSWSKIPYIVTVLDLIPLVCSHLYTYDGAASWRFKVARWLELRAIRGAELILAISQSTADDVTALLGIPANKIRVTSLGIEQKFFQRLDSSFGLDSRRRLGISLNAPLLAYVGGIDARKNIPRLVEIFSEVCRNWKGTSGAQPSLLLAGRIDNDKNYPALAAQISKLGLSDSIHMPGFLPDDELQALLQTSTLFIFPSLYEGFGLPPLEALAMGVPVLSAKNSSLPEILGDAAHWFDPSYLSKSVETILDLLSCPEKRMSKVILGTEQAKRFTWERCCKTTYDAYVECAQRLKKDETCN